MNRQRKQKIHFMLMRVMLLCLAILVQFLILGAMIVYFNDYFQFYYVLNVVISLILCVFIISDNTNPAYKIAWVVPILAFPVFGVILYLFFSKNSIGSIEQRRRIQIKTSERSSVTSEIKKFTKDIRCALEEQNPDAAIQSNYLSSNAFAIPYKNCDVKYFSLGDLFFPAFLKDLESATKYIFLEYFIICEGQMWNAVLEILKQKAEQGVCVRIIYDDVGSIVKLPAGYDKYLERLGIECRVFSPAAPVLSSRLNNRDHRKIAVIDGKIAYTGGINLSDEYINLNSRLGHWKDSAVRISGSAVFSFTVMFISMWNYWKRGEEDYSKYYPDKFESGELKCVVQPYTDSPLDDEQVGENVYLNMISRAKKYLYIMTPYLIIDSEIQTSLQNLAKCGVDVRIVTPAIPDKRFVHAATRSYYESLIDSGIGIYEYTDGFVHAKTFVCDDIFATVGSINLDYRSLYLHFECGVWLYGCDCIRDIKEDFDKTFEKCRRIKKEDCKSVNLFSKFAQIIVRVFAPLL